MGEDKGRTELGDEGAVRIKVYGGDGCTAAAPLGRTACETVKLWLVWSCFFVAMISLTLIMIFHGAPAAMDDMKTSLLFQVESVSVTLEFDQVAAAHDLFQAIAKWNISFSVLQNSTTINFDVRVVCLSHQGSFVPALLQHSTNNNTIVFNATPNTILYPNKFPQVVHGLEFDVVLRAQAGIHIHQASCKDMRVEFQIWNLTKGTLVGGPKSCHLLH